MATGDSEQKPASSAKEVLAVLDEAKQSFLKAEKLTGKIDWSDNSKLPSLEVSHAYTKAAEIYSRAVDLIKAVTERKLSDHERLAFLAYYGYGISLHWKVHFATRLDCDDMTDELGDDAYKSLLMLHEALEITTSNQLDDLLNEESLACGILAEELEDQGNYEDAYELFQRNFSIYEIQCAEYEYVLGLGSRMISCFLAAQKSNVDADWLTKKAPTAVDCLEKMSIISDLAMKGDEDTLARFGLPQSKCEAYVKSLKDWITLKLEAVKGSFPDADIAHLDKKAKC